MRTFLSSSWFKIVCITVIVSLFYTFLPVNAIAQYFENATFSEEKQKDIKYEATTVKSVDGGKGSYKLTINVPDSSQALLIGLADLLMEREPYGISVVVKDPNGITYGRSSDGKTYTRGLTELTGRITKFEEISDRGFLVPGDKEGVKTLVLANPTPGIWHIEISSARLSEPFILSVITLFSTFSLRNPQELNNSSTGVLGELLSCDNCKFILTLALVVIIAVLVYYFAAGAIAAAAAALLKILVTAFGIASLGFFTWLINQLVQELVKNAIKITSKFIGNFFCVGLGYCGDNEPPLCTIDSPESGDDLSGFPSISVTASDASGVEFVEFQYSTDYGSWYPLYGPDSQDGKDYYGDNGWILRFDTKGAGVIYDPSVWVRARAKDSKGNFSEWNEIYVSVDNRITLPTSINVSASLNPSTSSPSASVYVSGTAQYNTGKPVYPGTVNISVPGSQWTTPVNSNGAFGRFITSPNSTGSYSVSVVVSDGTLQGSTLLSLQVSDAGTSPQCYTLYDIQTCVDVDPNYQPIRATQFFRSDDVGVLTWLHLKDVFLDDACHGHPIKVKWEYYKPDGQLFQYALTYQIDDPGKGYYYPDYYTSYGWYISGYNISEIEGEWTVKVYVDAKGTGYEYKTSASFVLRYQFDEHKMAKDVQTQDPYDPINTSNIFSQTDSRAITWARFNNLTEGLEARWDFYEPNGGLYGSFVLDPPITDPGSGYYYPWAKIWGWININGYLAQNKTGDWRVDVSIKDPFGSWDKEYTDYFKIIESPNIFPVATLYLSPSQPTDIEQFNINVTATDNAYLRKVELIWDDGSAHSQIWDNILSNTFNTSMKVGPFEKGKLIKYYARAWDNSGNQSQSIINEYTIKDEDTSPPNFANFSPDSVLEGSPFHITCDITSNNGIFDDTSGSAGQGVYVIWDNDGEILNSSNEVKMSFLSGSLFTTDIQIPGQSIDANFVYKVIAYTNDFDQNYPYDRDIGISSEQRVAIIQNRTAWYVSGTGNDTTGNGSAVYPFFTIRRAIQATNYGDTILVGAGTYYENDTLISGITLLSQMGADSTVIRNADTSSFWSVVMYCDTCNDVHIEGFTITAEPVPIYATYNGRKGIYFGKSNRLTLKDNRIVGVTSRFGPAGAYLVGDSMLIVGNTIAGNKVVHRDWAFNTGDKNPNKNKFSSEQTSWNDMLLSGESGVGLYLSGSHNMIDSNDFSSNFLDSDGSGKGIGLYCSGTENVISRNVFNSNFAITGEFPTDIWTLGGGLYLDSRNTLVQKNSFTSNWIDSYYRGSGGAGLCVNSDSCQITNNIFYQNKCSAYSGKSAGAGAFILGQHTKIDQNEFKLNKIKGNRSEGRGGAIHVEGDFAFLSHNIIALDSIDAIQKALGGGINIEGDSSVIMENTIYGNFAKGIPGPPYDNIFAGGGLSNLGTGSLIINNIIANNAIISWCNETPCSFSPAQGGGIHCSAPILYVDCNDVYNNIADTFLSNFSGCSPNSNDFSVDPRFCSADSFDFHLFDYSPCDSHGVCGRIGALGVGCFGGPPLSFLAFSPVDLTVIDPVGDAMDKWNNTIFGGEYFEVDRDGDGFLEDSIYIPFSLNGVYQILVQRDTFDSSGEGTFSLAYRLGEGPLQFIVQNVTVPGFGELDTVSVSPTPVPCNAIPGDANANGAITLGDIIHLVNYVFDKDRLPCLGINPGNCWTPDPFCRGDANSTGSITLGDIVYLVNYVFDKDRLPCLGINPGNCWTPVASGACCLPVP